ncbi:response regulator [Rhizobium halophilum]|uniref:response regulator n=1 Tax=Rhizobium halophilum TaxID=2846852 RepID=UPI00293EFD32|nr:response regulator [Rhizobium halophilum]
MKHVLVIDDDAAIRSLLTGYLAQHNFKVTGVSGSHRLAPILATDNVDAMIVDLNLGQEDGLDIIRRISSSSDLPIIIISGDRQEEADKVIGLELGAVDYITKPFGTRELLARLRGALRDRPPTRAKTERRIFGFGDWTLDVKSRKLVYGRLKEVKLTAAEFNLLVALLNAPRNVLSREQLLSASRVYDEEVFDRSIDVLVLRLRRKLEEDPSRPKLIRTERGAGYFLDANVTIEDKRALALPARKAQQEVPDHEKTDGTRRN